MAALLSSPWKTIISGLSRLKLRRKKRRTPMPVLPPPRSTRSCPAPQLPALLLSALPQYTIPNALDILPPELLIQILEYADVPSILHCAAVCRRFRDIVSSSSILQYRVALNATGLEDAGGPPSVADRLRALQSRERSWRTFKYRDRVTLDVGPGAYRPCYDLHGGVFYVGRRTAPSSPINRLSWLPLPSGFDIPGDPPQWRSVQLDVSIDDFALDRHQDLVVLVEMLLPGSTTLKVHMRSFSTLQPHPRALNPILTSACEPVSLMSTIVVDLTGHTLGLLFTYDVTGFTDKDVLTIWDWTTGQMLCRLQETHPKLTSFLFLTEDIFLVPNVSDCTVEIYSRRGDSFALVACYALPPQANNCILHNASSRYKSRGVFKPPPNSSLDEQRSQYRFFLAPEMELVVLSLEYRAGNLSNFFTLIAQKDLFMRIARGTPRLAAAFIPWEEWGPRATRILREPFRQWDYFFAGSRFVTLTESSVGGVDDEDSGIGIQRMLVGPLLHLRVLDFHMLSVAHGDYVTPTRRIRVVRDPSIIRAGPVFADEVQTCLPYVETTTMSTFELCNVMCDHERVIGLKTNAVLDMESLDVFLL